MFAFRSGEDEWPTSVTAGAAGGSRPRTVRTRPEDGEVPDVRGEPLSVQQCGGERLHHVIGRLDDPSARAAHEVDVSRGCCRMVCRRAFREVGVPNQSEVLEQFEGPVHRGHVDRGGLLPDLDENLVGRGVPKAFDGTQHELALRSEPVTLGP